MLLFAISRRTVPIIVVCKVILLLLKWP